MATKAKLPSMQIVCRYFSKSLPHGAVGWSEVCDCGISWSYLLTHTRSAAIENANTIEERRSKIVKNCFRLPFVATLATNDNQKHCFYRFLIHVRRLVIVFSIAAYPVCYCYKEEAN